ncbi:MAG: methyltransferase domain-containing protein [Fibrobacteria bacterium]|nr:methyltransferase domain-containing protein [Fibrobacteria bacterium]
MNACCPLCQVVPESNDNITFSRCPVNINVYYSTRALATASPREDMHLCSCPNCSFIYNASFNPSLIHFNEAFCSTQSASPSFIQDRQYLIQSVLSFVENPGTILEVGCGDGYFLSEFTSAAKCKGIGYDPSCPDNISLPANIQIHRSFYTPDNASPDDIDILLCSMVLEHQPDPVSFLQSITKALKPSCCIVIEVPNIQKSISTNRFHDFYYDHCNYFSPETFHFCLHRSGLEILKCWEAFDENNLVALCRKSPTTFQNTTMAPKTPPMFEKLSHSYQLYLEEKSTQLNHALSKGPVTFWGASAKCQTVLNTFNLSYQQIPFVLDNNPQLWGKFMVGTGNQVCAPAQLASAPYPKTIFLTNDTYITEITRQLTTIGISNRPLVF